MDPNDLKLTVRAKKPIVNFFYPFEVDFINNLENKTLQITHIYFR